MAVRHFVIKAGIFLTEWIFNGMVPGYGMIQIS